MALPRPESVLDDRRLFVRVPLGPDEDLRHSDVSTRLVTIEHTRHLPVSGPSVEWQSEPQEVYGTLSITVSEKMGVSQDKDYVEPVRLSCLRIAALEAYDVMADQAEQASEIDSFYYRRQHLVAFPKRTTNLLQPQVFIQEDYGGDLSWMRRVLDESLGNLVTGGTLKPFRPPYGGAAQDVDAMEEEEEERESRRQNMDPVFYG